MDDLKQRLTRLSEADLDELHDAALDLVASANLGPMTTRRFSKRTDDRLSVEKAKDYLVAIAKEKSRRGLN